MRVLLLLVLLVGSAGTSNARSVSPVNAAATKWLAAVRGWEEAAGKSTEWMNGRFGPATPNDARRFVDSAVAIGAAEFFGIADSLGTIAPGKLADLVLLDANPLEDIRNTRRINAVFANGRLLDRAALDKLLAKAAQLSGT